WVPYLAWGTVLDEGESPGSEHARVAGGPGWALAYHGAYEFSGADAVRGLLGGDVWMDTIEKTPEDQRHLAVHSAHCVGLNDADRAAWDAGGSAMLPDVTVSGTRDEVRRRVD